VTSQELLGKLSVGDTTAAIQEIKTGKQRMRARGAMTWCIQFQEVAYPANYVLGLAVKFATGETFVSAARKGGKETIKILEKLLERDFKFNVIFRQAGSTTRED
jgi:hypothetical protein